MNTLHAFRRHVRRQKLSTLVAADQQIWEAILRARERGESSGYMFWLVRPRREVCDAAQPRRGKL